MTKKIEFGVKNLKLNFVMTDFFVFAAFLASETLKIFSYILNDKKIVDLQIFSTASLKFGDR